MQEAQVSKLFIKSALAVNTNIGTVTLPLHRGTSSGHTVWYVITESSDKEDAQRRGVNFSERMAHALGTKAVQRAHFVGGHIGFPGTVDFSPTRVVVPGPKGFPPAKFAPGAVGDAKYSPLVTTDGRIVLNATQVANKQRQGLQSALLGQGDPLNIPSAAPDDRRYSPIWDIHPAVWTKQAIQAGLIHRLTSESAVANAFQRGELVSAGTGPPNSDLLGLRSLPGISMCPIVLQLG